MPPRFSGLTTAWSCSTLPRSTLPSRHVALVRVRGVNWLRGFPPTFCKDAQGHQTDLFFSDQLDSLGAHFLRNSFLKDAPSDPSPIRSVKRDLRRHLCTLEGRGYALCEFSKVVSHQLGVAR